MYVRVNKSELLSCKQERVLTYWPLYHHIVITCGKKRTGGKFFRPFRLLSVIFPHRRNIPFNVSRILRQSISARNKTQEGYRFSSTALCPLYIVLVKLNYLSKGHTRINCVHTIRLLFQIWHNFCKVCEIISYFLHSIALGIVKINKKSVKFLCILYKHFVKIRKNHFHTLPCECTDRLF